VKKQKLFVVILFIAAATISLSIFATRNASADASPQATANQIIALEKSSVEAWKRKDKAFYADFFADDATYFGPTNPYLETDPKENFMPKFEQYAEIFKYVDWQMYNARVQVYGDAAILTYNSNVMGTFAGQPLSYTSKVTSVYVKQGNTWRSVHAHESMNPAGK
jgi:uncharacterized protein (TIGR02246 family)